MRGLLPHVGSRVILRRTHALLVAVGDVSALDVVVALGVLKDRTPPAWTPKDHLSPAVNDAYSRMLNEIAPKRVVSRKDVEYVLSCMKSEEGPIRQPSFVLAFELDKGGKVRDAESRELIRDCYLDMLHADDWVSRALSVGILHELGWAADPEVRRRIEPLRNDPDMHVVEEVIKALGGS